MSYSNQPPPPPPPGGYGAGQYGGGYAQPTTSQKAVWALVTGILGFCCGPASIAAIILGYMGKNDINSSNGALKGGGMAQAGLILGIIALVLNIIYWILVATGAASFNFNTN
jgi:Domain of unknown function (DUF4190)